MNVEPDSAPSALGRRPARRARRLRIAFSIVEVLAAAVLLGVGVVAALGAIGSITRAEARMEEKEILQNLASDKLREVLATFDFATPSLSGDFEDRGLPNIRWEVEVSASGISNLERVRIVVTPPGRTENAGVSIETLYFRPPATGGGFAGAPSEAS
ncbi:MAG: hypothetical protein SNJ61_04810, partial [Fimbriimonadaceae bacterium]